MKERVKVDAYKRWKSGEYATTRTFGLGINKPDVHFGVRNGLPPSISAWVQKYGRAGRDESAIIRVKDCEVEFVYIRPEDFTDQRRWIGGLKTYL